MLARLFFVTLFFMIASAAHAGQASASFGISIRIVNPADQWDLLVTHLSRSHEQAIRTYFTQEECLFHLAPLHEAEPTEHYSCRPHHSPLSVGLAQLPAHSI